MVLYLDKVLWFVSGRGVSGEESVPSEMGWQVALDSGGWDTGCRFCVYLVHSGDKNHTQTNAKISLCSYCSLKHYLLWKKFALSVQ